MQREYLCNFLQHAYSLVENLLKTMLKAICAKKAGRSCFGFCLLKICSDKDYLGIT